jgi:hypothetical protein
MSKRMKVAFGCYLLALLLIALLGVIYLFRMEFMPYHAVALGKSWADIDQALQILLLALMKAFGGASLATAVAMGVLLVIPFRQGICWARWTIPVIGLVAELPALYATLSVTQNTPATPPWMGALFVVALLIAGFILSMGSKRIEQPVLQQSR